MAINFEGACGRSRFHRRHREQRPFFMKARGAQGRGAVRAIYESAAAGSPETGRA
jgi:hypothetical protein